MILRAKDRIAQPWKNGGGVTREVMAWPQGAGFDDFLWRVSIAEVREAGPFSRFENIDRVLTILEGRLRLGLDGGAVELDAQSDPFAFPGDVSCHGTPEDGAVMDLNVMTRRGRCSARVERLAHGERAGASLLVALEPWGNLDRYDAVWIEKNRSFAVGGKTIAITIA